MLDLQVVQVVIQGGAVGLLLIFGYGVYRVARRLIDIGYDFATNHVAHLTETLVRVESTLERLDRTIEKLVEKEK